MENALLRISKMFHFFEAKVGVFCQNQTRASRKYNETHPHTRRIKALSN